MYLNCNYLKGVINKSWMKNTRLEKKIKIIYLNKKIHLLSSRPDLTALSMIIFDGIQTQSLSVCILMMDSRTKPIHQKNSHQ